MVEPVAESENKAPGVVVPMPNRLFPLSQIKVVSPVMD